MASSSDEDELPSMWLSSGSVCVSFVLMLVLTLQSGESDIPDMLCEGLV